MNNGTQLSTDETKGSAAAVAAAGGRFQYKDRTADAQNWAQRAATAHKNTLIRTDFWPEDAPLQPPKKGTDYRDVIPPTFDEVVAVYAPYVRDGEWTFGLFDMWTKKAKVAKQSVHIPCWDSCRLNPCAWRAVCFGRTLNECCMTGLDRFRWARYTYGAHMGREYDRLMDKVVKKDSYWLEKVRALGCGNYIFGALASFGIGQAFSAIPNTLDCAACVDCHPREKLRRKYNLPTTFGLPPGCDDCCVHFFCMYCASHQEARELAVRGIDGKGMHILDVLPASFSHVPGIETAIAARRARWELLDALPPQFLSMGERIRNEPGIAATFLRSGAANIGARTLYGSHTNQIANGKQQPMLKDKADVMNG